jgi:hypothetical protein
MMKRVAALLVLIAAALGFTAAAAPASGPAHVMPFKAQAVGHDTSESFGADGIHLTSLVTGEGTEIGAFTQTLDYVISYDLVHLAGTSTITAADGSRLFLTFQGTEPGFADGIFPTPFAGAFAITGGAGRFAATAGGGSIDGIDYGEGSFVFTLAGSLSR